MRNQTNTLMRKISFLLDDIKTDERFLHKWGKELAHTKDKKRTAMLKLQIKSITEHMNRRQKLLDEYYKML